jgi:hypothetical protein
VDGFGLIHDGTLDTVANFLRLDGFFFPGKTEEEKDVTRRQLHEYIMAFDTGMAPVVGRQLTVSDEGEKQERDLLDLLVTRAAAGDCDLTARGWEGTSLRGWLYRDGAFLGNRRGEASLALEGLLNRYRRSREPVTFTCVPPGDGVRSALDRDLDGRFDGDEGVAGSNSARATGLPPSLR